MMILFEKWNKVRAPVPSWLHPNIITASRLFLAFFIFKEICQEKFLLAGIYFLIASLLDILDGLVARSNKKVTFFGAFFDPLVDKIINIGTLIFLLFSGVIKRCDEFLQDIFAFLVIFSAILAFSLTVARIAKILIFKNKEEKIQANHYGKMKTWCESILIFFILVGGYQNNLTILIDLFLLFLACLFSWLSLYKQLQINP